MTLFDSPASAAHWVLISAFGGWRDPLNVVCVTLAAAAYDAVLEEKHQRLVGSPLLLLCLCVLGLCVCACGDGGLVAGGEGVPVVDCCVCRALFETGPRGPELKPYLRGFGTDGVPLFQDVY